MRVTVLSYLRIVAVGAASLCLVAPALAQTAAPNAAKLGQPALAAPQGEALPDPGSLFNLARTAGAVYRFTVVGSTQGGVWGKGVYTSDSVLAAAAVHAGLLEPGEAGIVTVEIVAGLPSYEGITSNGVTSRSYGPWEFGYRLTGVEPVAGPITLPFDGDMTQYRGQDGAIHQFEVTGSTDGAVWGDMIYSDDSALPAAAVHAGVLDVGETGVVRVEILPGQESYDAAERNGIASQSYGSWSGSYRVLPPLSKKATGKLSN